MAFDESLAARIRDALAPKKGVEEKTLFGCVSPIQASYSSRLQPRPVTKLR